ncbi:MAG: hypothetical protein ACJ8F7_21750 [Gemmataceae bacterium]
MKHAELLLHTNVWTNLGLVAYKTGWKGYWGPAQNWVTATIAGEHTEVLEEDRYHLDGHRFPLLFVQRRANPQAARDEVMAARRGFCWQEFYFDGDPRLAEAVQRALASPVDHPGAHDPGRPTLATVEPELRPACHVT